MSRRALVNLSEKYMARATRKMAEAKHLRHHQRGFASRRTVKRQRNTLRREAGKELIEAELILLEAEQRRGSSSEGQHVN